VATTRTTVAEIKSKAVDAYRSGREMGLDHEESIKRAVSLSEGGTYRAAVAEWVAAEHDRRWEPGH